MCNLCYKYGTKYYKLGTFQNQAKAKLFWTAIKPRLEDKLGTGLQPVYVETKKGRGK